MAIYHLSINPISRSAGRSATGAAAYRAAEKIVDERTGDTHDYTRKRGVSATEMLFPAGEEKITRAELWNEAEKAEKRKDGRVAREYVVALPAELPAEQRQKLACEFARRIVMRYGCVADVCLHRPGKKGDDRNFHAHILTTTRKYHNKELGEKCDIELSDSKRQKSKGICGKSADDIKEIRKLWESQCNRYLKEQGVETRISAGRRADDLATCHLGVAAAAMERRGEQSDRCELNREIIKAREEIKTLTAEKEQAEKELNRQQSFAQNERRLAERAAEEERKKADAKKTKWERMSPEEIVALYDRIKSEIQTQAKDNLATEQEKLAAMESTNRQLEAAADEKIAYTKSIKGALKLAVTDPLCKKVNADLDRLWQQRYTDEAMDEQREKVLSAMRGMGAAENSVDSLIAEKEPGLPAAAITARQDVEEKRWQAQQERERQAKERAAAAEAERQKGIERARERWEKERQKSRDRGGWSR